MPDCAKACQVALPGSFTQQHLDQICPFLDWVRIRRTYNVHCLARNPSLNARDHLWLELPFLFFSTVSQYAAGTPSVFAVLEVDQTQLNRPFLDWVLIRKTHNVHCLFEFAAGSPSVSAALEVDQTQLNRLFLNLVRIGETHGVRFPREFGLFLKQLLYFDRYTRILAPQLQVCQELVCALTLVGENSCG